MYAENQARTAHGNYMYAQVYANAVTAFGTQANEELQVTLRKIDRLEAVSHRKSESMELHEAHTQRVLHEASQQAAEYDRCLLDCQTQTHVLHSQLKIRPFLRL